MRLAARPLAILLAGFCLLGADFGRSDLGSLVLGQTTEQQARERFGDPARQSTSKVADKVVTSLHYSHAEPRSTLVPSRAMVLSFHEGTLVSFDYTSSFTTDDTAFDESTARGIKRAVTTRAEVHRLVGPPSGQSVFPSPSVRVPGQRADHYSSSRTMRIAESHTIETTTKFLLVTFDDHDVVIETTVAVNTTSKPLR
jgi:hypothetical protein